ncbi:ImmA/IrrE family metallo-endopeptidase [Streptomyces sp. NPDC058155]|uniref:ImmA/IrrE family metallo-endopeptidase n=1 Tax=Streptomyces sp. NPDC058155 TaxID=3346359 RepID=UPI0036EC9EB0
MNSVLAASPGERLRTLRDLMGLTQAQVSAMSGVAASWISDAENEHIDPQEDKLLLIAKATETPIGFFYVQPKSVPLDSLRFRKLASAKRTVTKRVHALYSESYRVSDDLITRDRYPTPPLPFTDADTLEDSDIENLADQTRVALRLAPDKPIPHLTRALERGGVAVAPMVLSDHSGSDEPTVNAHFGVSYWSGLGDTALIGYFPASGDRDRFTLAHELGHLVLHTFRPRAKNAEAEANRFASALLMPYDRAREELNGETTLTDYARKKAIWGVSIQALIMRGAAVGRIDDTRKRSLYVQLSQRNWRKREPVEVGQEEPLLLWTLLQRQFGEKPYISGSEHLSIPPAVLRSIAPTPRPRNTSKEPPKASVESENSTNNIVQFASRQDRRPSAATRLAR